MRVPKTPQMRQVWEVLHPGAAERVVKPGPGTAVHQCIVEPARSQEVSGLQREVSEPWAEKYLGISGASPPRISVSFLAYTAHRANRSALVCLAPPQSPRVVERSGQSWSTALAWTLGWKGNCAGGQTAAVNCACVGCKPLEFRETKGPCQKSGLLAQCPFSQTGHMPSCTTKLPKHTNLFSSVQLFLLADSRCLKFTAGEYCCLFVGLSRG